MTHETDCLLGESEFGVSPVIVVEVCSYIAHVAGPLIGRTMVQSWKMMAQGTRKDQVTAAFIYYAMTRLIPSKHEALTKIIPTSDELDEVEDVLYSKVKIPEMEPMRVLIIMKNFRELCRDIYYRHKEAQTVS